MPEGPTAPVEQQHIRYLATLLEYILKELRELHTTIQRQGEVE